MFMQDSFQETNSKMLVKVSIKEVWLQVTQQHIMGFSTDQKNKYYPFGPQS
jgi:hypothetical protein